MSTSRTLATRSRTRRRAPDRTPASRTAIGWGVGVRIATAATPLLFWWMPTASVHAIGLVFIAAVYIGFAVADGRRHVLAVETVVAAAFVVTAFAVTGQGQLLPAGMAAHGVKDLSQHRTGFVDGTRWWPPFCVTVDWVAALVLVAILAVGANFG